MTARTRSATDGRVALTRQSGTGAESTRQDRKERPNQMEVHEQLDLVTLKHKVAIPILGHPDKSKMVAVNALVGNLLETASDERVMYAYYGVEFNRDGTTTNWETGSLKKDYFDSDPETPNADWNLKRVQQWAMGNRTRQKIVFRPDNVESVTTITVKQ